MLVIYSHKGGKNEIVASIISKSLECESKCAQDCPNIRDSKIIIFVAPNTGDEELTNELEKFLLQIEEKNKNYIVCELGNYLGFEYSGCKNTIFKLMKKLDWNLISHKSIDSFPTLDTEDLLEWIKGLNF
jgi:flavodoxin